MTTENSIPDIHIRFTAHDHIAAYDRLHHEACWQLTQAGTPELRAVVQQWIDDAASGRAHWQGVVEAGR